MDGRRLIKVTDTSALAAVGWRGRPVLEQRAELTAFLAARGADDLTHLFAEPVLGGAGGNGYRAVSWYTPLQGDVVPLDALPESERPAVIGRLRSEFDRLAPLLAEAEAGGLLHRSLLVAGAEDIHVAFGHPVLVNWGLVPTAVMQDEVSLARHWAATGGRFTTLPPPRLMDDPPPLAGDTSLAAAAAVAAPAAAVAAVVSDVPWYQRPGIWAACAVVLLLIGLFLGMLLGVLPWRLGPEDPLLAAGLERQRAVNAALEAEIDRLRGILGGDVCALAPAVIAPLATLPPARPQGEAVVPAPQHGVVVPPVVADPGPGGQPAGQEPPAAGSIAELAEAGTALVLTPNSTGSGFFISPTQLITNRHVIEQANGRVMVVSKALGGVRPATVRVVSQGDQDYALLEVEAGAQSQVVPMRIAPTSAKLDRVVAAGYPGLISDDDPKFQKLLNGDATAIPELVFSEGVISTHFESAPPVIVHTAVISQGNSGGPLIDACGRVVGINTLIKVSRRTTHQGNYAQAGSDVQAFFKAHGVDIPTSSGACRTGAGTQ